MKIEIKSGKKVVWQGEAESYQEVMDKFTRSLKLSEIKQ